MRGVDYAISPRACLLAGVRIGWKLIDVSCPHLPGAEINRTSEMVRILPAKAATNREIASSLYLSPHTVKEHTSSLYRKLGVRNRAEAVQKAQRLGLIS